MLEIMYRLYIVLNLVGLVFHGVVQRAMSLWCMCVIFHIREATNTLCEEIEFGSSRSSLQIDLCIFVNPFIHLIMSHVESSKLLSAKQIPTPFIKIIPVDITI